ncbi:MAG: alpha/beta fold hydrolase [Beijerinckiaceae bacterium]
MTRRIANGIRLTGLLLLATFAGAIPASPSGLPVERWTLTLRGGEVISAFVWPLRSRSTRPRLAILSHGVSTAASLRAEFDPLAYDALARVLNQLGYLVVLPRRPGYSGASTATIEDYGTCDDPHYVRTVDVIADVIGDVLNYATSKRLAQSRGVVLVGHSGGGLGSLTFAARNDPRVLGVINISGGLGGRSFGMPFQVCAPGRLMSLVQKLGASTKTPSLWLYSDKDTYFSPTLSGALAAAYKRSGGLPEYALLPTMGPEGHTFVFEEANESIWKQHVVRFINRLESSSVHPLTRAGDGRN